MKNTRIQYFQKKKCSCSFIPDLDFVNKIYFTDETWIEFKNANDGRNGSFVPPCSCDFGDGPTVCHCEHSKSGFQNDA